MFLGSVVPPGDHSSANLRGTYNTSNVTILEDPVFGKSSEEQETAKMEVDEQDAKSAVAEEEGESRTREATPVVEAKAPAGLPEDGPGQPNTLAWEVTAQRPHRLLHTLLVTAEHTVSSAYSPTSGSTFPSDLHPACKYIRRQYSSK